MRIDAAGSGTDRRCPSTALPARVPFGSRPPIDVATCRDKLRLQRERAGDVRLSHQRRVRRDDDDSRTRACDRSAFTDSGSSPTSSDSVCSNTCEPLAIDELGQRRQIFPRMELRLPAVLDRRAARRTAPRRDIAPRTPAPRRAAPRPASVGRSSASAARRRVLVARTPTSTRTRSLRRSTMRSICSIAASPASQAACA